jgi:very-short-patch-repair endonuclease
VLLVERQALHEISRRQRGVVSRSQARAIGMSSDAIRHRLASGHWQRLAAGTYATFTGEVPRAALRWGAVLRAGPGAILAHRSAAEEVGFPVADGEGIHVAIPTQRRVARLPGLIVHRSAHVLVRRHPTRLPPQTRVEETVIDLACGAAGLDDAMGWIATACGRRLTTPDRLARALNRRPRVSQRAELRELVGDAALGCHSVLEWRYLRDVDRAHGLPAAERQDRRPRAGGTYYDDVRYAAYRVRVELDGQAAHPRGSRWRDFRRDNAAVQDGDVVLRYGYGDVVARSCAVARQIAEVLRFAGWFGAPRPCGADCAAINIVGTP